MGQRAFDYAGIMRKLILSLCLIFCYSLQAAEVYKSVDQYGNTVFSDVPSDNAEKIDVQELPTIPALKEQPFRATPPKPVERYSSVAISSPSNDETYFKSEGDVVVSVSTQPHLFPSDTIVLYLNSNEFLSGQALTFRIPELDRGTYQLRAAIKDASGKILKSSETVTFHLRQNTIIKPN